MTTMNQMGLVPPQNLDAERAVLGAMMLNRQALLTGMEHLRSKDFYRPEHARIFTAITALFNNDSAVDLVTVSNELSRMGVLEQIGGESTVAAVCGSVASVGNVEYYCRIVQDRSLMRQMIDSCSEVMGECFRADEPARDVLSRAQGRIFELHQASGKKSFIAVKEMLSATLKAVQDFHDRKEHISGVPTGFKDLDQLTSGFQSGDLVIVAGRPSMGKTALAMNMAENVAIDPRGPRRPVGIFSLEMSTQSLVLRLLCSHARISAHRLRTGYLREDEWRTIALKAGDLDNAQIYIDDSGSSNIMEIRAKSRRLKMEHPDLAMILVDYLQLVSGLPGTENRQQEISQVSRSLKALAKELELPVVALSQLSRAVESRGNAGRPMLSDLRESGAIEQDADVVMFVYRPGYYKNPNERTPEEMGKAEIILAKQRNGPTGSVPLTFLPDCTRFEDTSAERDDGFP